MGLGSCRLVKMNLMDLILHKVMAKNCAMGRNSEGNGYDTDPHKLHIFRSKMVSQICLRRWAWRSALVRLVKKIGRFLLNRPGYDFFFALGRVLEVFFFKTVVLSAIAERMRFFKARSLILPPS